MPEHKGVAVNTEPEDQFLGIAELTFSNAEDRATWFEASTILMDDEHDIFSKAIGYTTSLEIQKQLRVKYLKFIQMVHYQRFVIMLWYVKMMP